jgi:hypothetical protein
MVGIIAIGDPVIKRQTVGIIAIGDPVIKRQTVGIKLHRFAFKKTKTCTTI